MKLFCKSLVAGLILSVSVFAEAQTVSYKADLFQLGSDRKTKLYTMTSTSTTEGETTNTLTQYFDLEGKVVFEDKATLKGLQLVKNELAQKQTGATALIEFDGKTAKFTKTEGGKTKDYSETPKLDFVVSANFQRYIHSKFADLLAGKTIEYRYGVWARQETVGFEVKKIKETGEGDAKRITLLKKPSSFLISKLVDPIEFVYNADGSKLLELKGRVPPMQDKGGKFKDLDCDVVYSY